MFHPYRGLKPQVPAEVFIAETAEVIGNVIMAPEASIWYHVVIRGDMNQIHIGKGSNIQDGTVIHSSLHYPVWIGDYVLVGHAAILHGCTVQDHCLIGIGAIVLDGAEIGTGSILAAGTLVQKDVVIPPRSLVIGTPGRVVRRTSDADLAKVRAAVQRYIQFGKDYLQEVD